MEEFSKNTPKIEQLAVKEGVGVVFEQHPELSQIGTQEQYSNYLDTVFPESLYKDIFLHGTMSEKLFEVEEWNLNQTPDSAKNLGIGYYFAKDKDIAERYSGYGKGTIIYAVLDIQHPVFTNITRNDNKGNRYPKERKVSEIIGEGKDAIMNIEYADKDNYSSNNEFFDIYTGPTDEKGLPARQDIYRSIPTVTQLAVIDKSQIHFLGSRKDMQMFKEFIGNLERTSGSNAST